METGKLFIGPRLRALRLERGLTQTDFARLLGVSGSLVNLLERNQRSASLAVLMRLSDVFGLEMAELTSANTQVSLQQLRKTLSDPAVGVDDISIDELRSAMDLAPKVVEGLMGLFDSYQLVQERLAGTLETTEDRSKSLRASEQRVHEFFQRKGNYFEELEQLAQ
ncbi:MAG: helix-turn-helix domain-containing protein, partial [Alphaproteobacteria bacterium]